MQKKQYVQYMQCVQYVQYVQCDAPLDTHCMMCASVQNEYNTREYFSKNTDRDRRL